MARPNDHRALTSAEIRALEARGCRADDWRQVLVADGFAPDRLEDVRFSGPVRLGAFRGTVVTDDGVERPSGIRRAELHDVTVGDDCLIEHIHGYIARYDVADRAVIADVGTMSVTADAAFGRGIRINVLGETGDFCRLSLHRRLTAQEFALRASSPEWGPLLDGLAGKEMVSLSRGRVGEGARIVHTRRLRNVWVGDCAIVDCAESLEECWLDSLPSAPVRIGAGAIVRHTVLQAGAEVTDGAKVDRCLVGQAAHLGRGFTAESSLFFANSFMDNGEACAVCAGPYSVSHHKSTLLIGCQTSFFNAGSGTNMSNHAYKLGPLHHGTLDRGCKTASGTHLVWGGHLGAFTMMMGRFDCHADLSSFPFSYVFGTGGRTMLVPAVNFATVGTRRDVRKWPSRDGRTTVAFPRDLVSTFDALTPVTVSRLREGRQMLQSLQAQGGQDVCTLPCGVGITAKSLRRGIELYRWMEQLYIARHADPSVRPARLCGEGESWHDLLGLIVPGSALRELGESVRSGGLSSLDELGSRLESLRAAYPSFVQAHILSICSPGEIRAAVEAYPANLERYYAQLEADVRKEESCGSVSTRAAVEAFIAELRREQAEELKKARAKAAN